MSECMSIHKHKDGSIIGVFDLRKVEAVTVRKGSILTYIMHAETVEMECKDNDQAQKAILSFINRNDK